MFVRKKKNKSGLISVQVIDKSSGVYKVIKTIGSSNNQQKIDWLVTEAGQWIKQKVGQREIDFANHHELFTKFVAGIGEITVAGTPLLLGKIFDEIGFNQIADDLFRQLVIARLCFPSSKLRTTDYLEKYHAQPTDVNRVYRYLDKLHKKQKEIVQQISYRHTLKILNNEMSIVFYDVTTLYFEIDREDDWRKTGFSKEGKHQNPQIVLGLLVSTDGYPLAYEIFEGNKFEGHTMLPIIDAFKLNYKLKQLVVIADAGLLSNENIHELQNKGYEYILGARIKNEKREIQKSILNLKLKDGESHLIAKDNYAKLIINYSSSRAKKDKANREKALTRLEKQITSGKLTKAHINNRGYNKYLKLEGELKISIDHQKFKDDNAWDGLKGYLTNTNLSKEQIMNNYNHLWKIEKAFRISKHDLKIRPVYHQVKRRIEAHLCIAFVAYKIYKELERQLKQKQSDLSPEKAIDIAKTIYSVKLINPLDHQTIRHTVVSTEEQKKLVRLFDL